MDKKAYIRAKMFVNLTDMAAPLIRDRIISDRELNAKFGISVDGQISLGDAGPAFKRSLIAAAIKNVTAGKKVKCDVSDSDGVKWRLTRSKVGGQDHLVLTAGKRNIRVDDLTLLGEDRDLRLQIFDRQVQRTNLPQATSNHWRQILTGRPLDEDEVSELSAEFSATPVSRFGIISQGLKRGIGTDTLVPRSLAYYERLVGACETQETIQQYAKERISPFVAALFAWDRIEGTKQGLSLALHPSVVESLAELPLTASELAELMRWAKTNGDVVARGALIELCIRKPEFASETQVPLGELIKLYTGETQEPHEQFEFFAIAFVAVYGELAQTGLLSSKPVYWRRLAACAQASLICRAVLSNGKPLPRFVDWMRSIRSVQYFMQCNIDYRTDPRWMAEFIFPENLKCELAGRVMNAALANVCGAETLGVKDILTAPDAPSLRSQLTPLLTVMSGPLEGNVPAMIEFPNAELEKLRASIVTAAPTISSFLPLVGAVLISKIPNDFADLAAEALRRAQYKLDTSVDAEELPRTLRGLAQFAAISRNEALADALFITIRHYRRNFPSEIDSTVAFGIGIIACGSRADFREWCKSVGAFVNDFSFGRLTKEEADELFPSLLSLCNMVPELWAFAGVGLAAIESVKAA